MNFFKFTNRQIAGVMVSFILILILISFTYLALANQSKKTLDTKHKAKALSFDDNKIDIEQYDISSEFLYEKTGIASYYGSEFQNSRTANGEQFDMYAFTAAHRNLPFGTILRVTNLNTDKITLVRINDRGPFINNRILDLSFNAAKEIQGIGLPRVKIEGLVTNGNRLLDIRYQASDKRQNSDIGRMYYFGYSFNKPLVCLPRDYLVILDSTNYFNEAVKKYKLYSSISSGLNMYIFLPANDYGDSYSEESNSRYYLAMVEK
jgi:rare lipoprotein A